jgi:hypothetical protein
VAKTDLDAFLRALPPYPRNRVRGYVESVEDSVASIFRDAALEMTPELLEDFLFAAALRRLWQIVDSQFRLLDRSIELMGSADLGGMHGVRIGRTSFTRDSAAYAELAELHRALRELINQQELEAVIEASSLQEVARAIHDQG